MMHVTIGYNYADQISLPRIKGKGIIINKKCKEGEKVNVALGIVILFQHTCCIFSKT